MQGKNLKFFLACLVLSSLISNNVMDASKKLVIGNKTLTVEDKPIGTGACGDIYKLTNDPSLVLKHHRTSLDQVQLKCLKNLVGKDLNANLMKVNQILDDKNIILEFIDGIPFKEYKSNNSKSLTLDYFIDNWCIGLFQAQYKINELTGCYLWDTNRNDVIIRDNKPVLTDYDFCDPNSKKLSCSYFNGILTDAMTDCFDNSITWNDEDWNTLYGFLNELYKYELNQDNITSVINELKKIKSEFDEKKKVKEEESEIQKKINEMREKINRLEDTLGPYNPKVRKLQDELERLESKEDIDD